MTKKESLPANDPAHVLRDLAAKVGKPDAKLLAGLLAGTSDAELVAVGKTIDTSRIVKDASRIYAEAWAWWSSASAAERRLVRGVSHELLAIAVHEAVELEALRASIQDEGVAETASRVEVDAQADQVSGDALHLRDQAYDALRDAAAHDAGLREAVKAACGTAESADSLARGLEGLAGLLTSWIARKDASLSARLALASLDADYAAELGEAATAVRAKDAARERGKRSRLAQGTLDRKDGVSVLLLGQVLRGFSAAHERKPTIPKLQPISTRRLWSRRGAKGAEASQEPAPAADGT